MQLFDNPLSPYAQKVRLSLYEKNLAFDKQSPKSFQSDTGLTSDQSYLLALEGESPPKASSR